MTWHARQLAEQTGRTFNVTGADSGIGLEAARELVARGADVVLAVRDTAKGEQAAGRLEGPGSTRVVELDRSDLDQVADCAAGLLDRNHDLSGLICNAGVMGGVQADPAGLRAPDGDQPPRARRAGRRAVAAPARARCARRAGVEHRGARRAAVAADDPGSNSATPEPYHGRQVYRNTKQANLLFAQELHRRCARTGSPVSAVAVHPGASATNLFARQLEQAGHALLARASKRATAVLLQVACRRRAVHAAGARPQHTERRLRRPRPAPPIPRPS